MMNYNWNIEMSEVSVYFDNRLISVLPDVFTEEQAFNLAKEIYFNWLEDNKIARIYHPINGFDHEIMECFACSECHSEYWDEEIIGIENCPHCQAKWHNYLKE